MQKHIPYFLFLLLVFLITIVFFGLLQDFFYACSWAVVIAIVFHPAYRAILAHLPHAPSRAALVTLTLITLIFVLPVTGLVIALVEESADFYQKVDTGAIDPEKILDQAKAQLPSARQLLPWKGIDVSQLRSQFETGTTDLLKTFAGRIPRMTQNLFGMAVNFVLFLYLLFFMLRDGESLLERIRIVLPLAEQKEMELFSRFASVARATVKGGLIVALLQGILGGAAFFIVGIPGALLWGAVMVVLSLLPIGSGLIWGPAAIVLLFQGQYWQGIFLAGLGVFGIGVVDNFLRPYLIGSDIRMPDYLVVLSTLGGLSLFSLSGFVLGPMIAALFISCWEILGRDTARYSGP